MTSEIRANKQTNRVGLGTVEYTDTGIIVSGIVTCTELSGLTALNIAGVGTASTLDINGDIDVDGHTNLDNVSIAGVTTMNSTLNIVSAQPLIYLNNTSYENDYQVQNLAGTFTVRDVDRGNNVFQIGKTGLSTFSGQLDVQNNVTFDKDLDVDGHTNLDNVSIAGITTHQDDVAIRSSNPLILSNAANNASCQVLCDGGARLHFKSYNQTMATFENGVAITFYTDSGQNRLQINNNGNVSIAKDLDVDGHTNLDNVSIAGVTTTTDNIHIDADNKKLNIGDGLDLQLYHTGSRSEIINNTGDLIVQAGANSNLLLRDQTGAVHLKGVYGAQTEIYNAGNVRLETSSTGVNIPCSSGATIRIGGTSGSIYRTGSPGGGLHLSGAAILPTDGAGAVNNGDTDLGTSLYRWKGLYLKEQLDIDTNDATDGHIMAKFNGAESSNHAGLMIAHYLCGSDDNRTGLYWEHQNVSNERMWMGDDRRLYLKNSNPTSSTQNGRYIMTVAAGYPDFPSGSSADNAAYSALEIKKHYPNSQSGNYWIYDNNNVPRQIYCDMEIDGGGWMLWHDYNYGQTSMNEALGGSAASPSSNLARSNWGNYAYYNVLIRATDIDSTGERLHSIVQLDGNGAIKRIADYGGDFLLEDVGDLYQPNLNYYFNDASTGEYVGNTMMYQPQCGASGWESFSNGGNSAVFIRELDSRITPGMHRSCHLVERIYGFDDNGVPNWTVAESMHPKPFFGDVILGTGGNGGAEVADGTMGFMFENNRQIDADNGNNGGYAQGRMSGVLTGQFEVEFKLGNSWGWSQATAISTIQVAENLRDGANPYNQNTGAYAFYGIRNNNSNNQWNPFYLNPYSGGSQSTAFSGGANFSVGHVLWRVADGTIYARRKDGTHGTVNLGKWAGPFIVTSGTQSVMRTEWVNVWNADKSDDLNGRARWYK